ncbi:TatD family deoxyribonuclease [Alkalilimnicola ehrlichii]|uniref:TatD family deoxyribonuclease n=1 Tax=Alkalilimnicola ehrlichii TaxID=351052 RepID=A0A3E0WPB4_9GAMM|nr:TatD family hydrolase [Alkalilimnicola ehrlichii]RFA29976.1 TatD family deoxyribonuclease [Alkalilimnicola ehrlichii]RFA33795.1 TatD family deoxyribonuclease [Alkalilimnicola ehrlichii]
MHSENATIELVDSHCHLHMLGLDDNDPAEALATAEATGVGHFLNVAVDVESADLLKNMSRRFPQVSVSIGVHPSGTGYEPSVDELVELAAAPEFVAVGETGLDYVYNEGDLEWQRDRFRRHVRAAREVGKPLIIHTRGAPEDTLRILREEKAAEAGGVIHCFTEDWDTAQAFMDLGFYISLSGILTFRNAEMLRDVARRIPLECLLVETDAPYLAPVPHRGKQNRPAYVRLVAEQVAELQACTYQAVASATTDNFFKLFPLAARSV